MLVDHLLFALCTPATHQKTFTVSGEQRQRASPDVLEPALLRLLLAVTRGIRTDFV